MVAAGGGIGDKAEAVAAQAAPAFTMTRSPMVVPGQTTTRASRWQSSPITTPGPTMHPGPRRVRAPILAPAPTTASSSTHASGCNRAEGSMMAEA